MGRVVLVGRPNVGKSSFFNLITKLDQRIGNFPGVSVEKKEGKYGNTGVVDLPGIRSLRPASLDENIAIQEILNLSDTDRVLFIAHGMKLKNSLELFSQIADLQLPMALIVNFKDEMEQHQAELDLPCLQAKLGCPIVLLNSRTGDGLKQVQQLIDQDQFAEPNAFCRSNFSELEDGYYQNNYRQLLSEKQAADFWIEDSERRSLIVTNILKECLTDHTAINYLNRTNKLDRFLLHPIYGGLFFLVIMFLVFQSVFTLATYPMDWIEALQDQALSLYDAKLYTAIVTGVGSVLVFVPPMAILFFLLGILEHTGYLSRISFLSDRILRRFGLSGHSVMPLMTGLACAIPAIMSTRIIKDPRERFAVIMASPLMTCSARLPVYAILILVLFPEDQYFIGIRGLTLLGLYLLGLVATLVVAWIVGKWSKIPTTDEWILELPIYRTPDWKNIFKSVYFKCKSFVLRAGSVIMVISIVLSLMASYTFKSDEFLQQQVDELAQNMPNEQVDVLRHRVELEYSLLGYTGKAFEPVIKPLGYDWKIGIALISSFAAREVFVPTLVTIYNIEGTEGEDEDAENHKISQRLLQEINHETGESRFSVAVAVSLLLFYVFAMQCMSTFAIVKKETNSWYYAFAQFVFMFMLAYGFGYLSYTLLS